MTVSYTGEVATCRGLGCFWRLLFRWRGSIYKLLWQNLLVYSVLYFGLSILYRFFLNNSQRTLFEKMSLHCQEYGDLIPVSFVLGFYVSLVIKRWWDQYLCLPWPDNLALFVSSIVHGQDDRGRMMRRTIMRYVNLSLLLTLRMISPGVKKRFPTLDHAVEAGWMLSGEKKIFEDLEQKTHHAMYWMPLVWACGVVTRAQKENRIKDDFGLKTLIDELNLFRAGCGGMLNYDWISIPLVYTQVVTLAVYVFFLATLMGNQYLDPMKNYPKHGIDLVFPVFTFLQFFFYMGWLKVAESLVNPFGEDDDDFELNWLLDRNLQISYVIVDEMHQEHPEMLKDQYWDEVYPAELPYTAAAKQYQTGPPQHSAEPLIVPSHEAEFMPLDLVPDDRSVAVHEVEGEEEEHELDSEMERSSVNRGETQPLKIRRRPRCLSPNTSEMSHSASSLGKRSSVLNILTRIFHPQGSLRDEMSVHGPEMRTSRGRDSEEEISRSQLITDLKGVYEMRKRCIVERQLILKVIRHSGSIASLRSPNLHFFASGSHSVAPSRCSFQPDLLYPEPEGHDEMFSMSDLDIVTKASSDIDASIRRGSSPCGRQVFIQTPPSHPDALSVVRESKPGKLELSIKSQPPPSEQQDNTDLSQGVPELAPIFEHKDEDSTNRPALKYIKHEEQ